MLTIFRKHTQSWIIKLIFSSIILVFIFFFGYSRMQKGGGGTGIAAKVNGEVIPYGRYKIAFENSREFYSKIFPDKLSDEMIFQIRASALHQVINEALLQQLGNDLGLTVTVQEIYDTISENPNFQKDGVFDPFIYKNTFLPYFERRYGLNYESMLKHGLLADKTKNFLISHINIAESQAKREFDKDKSNWTYERYTVPVSISKEGDNGKYDIEGEPIAVELLQALESGSNKKVNELVNKYSLTRNEFKDIDINKKHQLLPSEQDSAIFFDLFSLSQEKPVLKEPVRADSSWYIFKLVEKKKPTEKEWEEEKVEFIKEFTNKKKQEYLMQWQETMKQKADIEEYVLNERK